MNELPQTLSSYLLFTVQALHRERKHLSKRLYSFLYIFDLFRVGNGLL